MRVLLVCCVCIFAGLKAAVLRQERSPTDEQNLSPEVHSVWTRSAAEAPVEEEGGQDGENYPDSDDGDVGHKRRKREALSRPPPPQVSINCREVVAYNVRDPWACSKITMGDLLTADPTFYNQGFTSTFNPTEPSSVPSPFSNPNPSALDLAQAPGRCRFDPYKAKLDPSTACLCVATRDTCTRNREGCYWSENKDSNYRECISSGEKFYNQLYNLLQKRGKKDFAINIRYGAVGAPGQLPMGPWGPAIIGQGPKSSLSSNPYGYSTAVTVPTSPYPLQPSYGVASQSPLMAGQQTTYGTQLPTWSTPSSLPAYSSGLQSLPAYSSGLQSLPAYSSGLQSLPAYNPLPQSPATYYGVPTPPAPLFTGWNSY